MELEPKQTAILQTVTVLFHFTVMLVIGGFCALFLTAYLTYDDLLFPERLTIYYFFIKYFWLGGLLIALIFIYFKRTAAAAGGKAVIKSPEFKPFGIFLVLLSVAVLSRAAGIPLEIFNFLTFLAAVYAVLSTAKQFIYEGNRPAWRHPATAGSILEGTAVLGSVTGLWIYGGRGPENTFAWILLAALVLEGLTIWTRFQFLSHGPPAARKAAEMMLVTHLPLFGSRFIFGLIMPLVYLLWTVLIQPLPFGPVILLVMAGEFLERILFFITALPEQQSDLIPPPTEKTDQNKTGES